LLPFGDGGGGVVVRCGGVRGAGDGMASPLGSGRRLQIAAPWSDLGLGWLFLDRGAGLVGDFFFLGAVEI
jgi:hypothetical protein